MAGADVGKVCAKVAGREDVRQQDGLFVADGVGEFDEIDVGKRNARFFRLQTAEAAGGLRAAIERGTGRGAVRVRVVALCVIAFAAVGAVAAGNGGRDDDAVADVDIAHALADLFDDADALMAEDGAFLHAAESATHEMQVGAADRRGGYANHRIGTGLHLGLRYVVQADVANVVEYHCFHDRLP